MDYALLKNNRKHAKKFFCEWEIPKRTSLAHKNTIAKKKKTTGTNINLLFPGKCAKSKRYYSSFIFDLH